MTTKLIINRQLLLLWYSIEKEKDCTTIIVDKCIGKCLPCFVSLHNTNYVKY